MNNTALTENMSINIKYSLSVYHDKSWYEVKSKHEYAFWIIQNGSLTIEYNQQNFELTEGDVFFFYPQILYHATTSEGCSFLYIHFDAILGQNYQALHFFPFDGLYHNSDISHIASLMVDSTISMNKKEPFSEMNLNGSLVYFLSTIMKKRYNQRGDSLTISHKHALARLQPALIYINHHLAEPIYIQDLATSINLSEKYFITFFKKTIGITPINYIIQVKMKKALEYLHEQQYSVKEVATLVGYSDIYTFSKVFKKTYGISPSKF